MRNTSITYSKFRLQQFKLDKKRVFLRADLNIPIKNGQIIDDFRVTQLLPTINYIQDNGGKVILATHMGRPTGYDSGLSTKILIDWFEKHNYKIDFEPDLEKAYEKSFTSFDSILLLENLRFFPGEQTQDKDFAHKLARLGDCFVNDAFGVLHRNDTSITLLPGEFPKENRSCGFLVEKELKTLDKLIKPEHPFLIIIGGGKVDDKITLLDKLLYKTDIIALCPAIVFSFLGDQKQAREIEQKAEEKNIKLLFPKDYLVTHVNNPLKGELSVIEAGNFSSKAPEYTCVSIGPETANIFADEIKKAKTVFFNGLPGYLERKETLENIRTLFKAMSESNAYSIIGGGDSSAAARLMGFKENNHLHISTGGGVILAYLTGKELPGLKALD